MNCGDLMSYVNILVTTSDEKEAKKIALSLFNDELIACANIIPKITSMYKWDGKFEYNSESILLLKTRKQLQSFVISRIEDVHSYDVPSIEVFDVSGGSKEFFRWIDGQTR